MIAAFLLVLQAAPAPVLPLDWASLPPLRYARAVAEDPTLAAFVRGEVAGGRCTAARQVATGWIITVDVAVLVQPDGTIRRTTPRAIDCPAVEQYAAGIAFSRALGNIDTAAISGGGWVRTTLIFSWR